MHQYEITQICKLQIFKGKKPWAITGENEQNTVHLTNLRATFKKTFMSARM
jgi:hypothetical protein